MKFESNIQAKDYLWHNLITSKKLSRSLIVRLFSNEHSYGCECEACALYKRSKIKDYVLISDGC